MNAEPLAEPVAEVESVVWVAIPKAGIMVWVAEAKLVEAKVSVYVIPAVPLMPTPEKVATPATALTVLMVVPIVEASPSPPLTVMVTEAVLLVTVLPKESLMVMIGWVVNAEPLGAPAGEVVSEAWAGVPTVGVMVWVAEVKPEEAKVSV